MKFIIVLTAFLSLNNGCSQSKINQDALSLEYSAHSRGSFKHIFINKKSIILENKRDRDSIKKNCSETDWNRIIDALKKVRIETISELKAPSKVFQFDGAALANLKITYGGKTYESQSFDHGNPPQEIAQLVKEILSISENIE